MTIIEALKSKDEYIRVSAGDRWMVADETGNWVVYERKRYAHSTTLLIVTADEQVAVKYLLKKERDGKDNN